MVIDFCKMSGTGNDFVIIDNRSGRIRTRRRLARRLCERHEGVGADGLLLLERSDEYDYTMRYYNADGSDGGMCGNGGRCIAWFAHSKGIAAKRHRFEALRRPYEARIVSHERVALSFPDPGVLRPAILAKDGVSGVLASAAIDTGSPHVVLRVPTGRLENFHVSEVGRSIRRMRRLFPRGTNVNVIEVLSSKTLSIRTYERGVEAETMACGTGSIACSIAGAELWGMSSPVTVKARGGTLKVSFRRQAESVTDVRLEGNARITFEGRFRV